MHVELDDPRFVPDLMEFLGRARVAARAGKSGRVFLELPGSDESGTDRTRLELIVTAWETMHPTAGLSVTGARRYRPSRLPLDAL